MMKKQIKINKKNPEPRTYKKNVRLFVDQSHDFDS